MATECRRLVRFTRDDEQLIHVLRVLPRGRAIYAHYQPSDHEADAVDRAFA
jgi:hypothetical protein